MKLIKTTISMALTLLVATGCGGGSSGVNVGAEATVTGTNVPVAATTDSAAVVSFFQQQIAATSESSEPLVIGDAVLAVDDTADSASI